MPWLVFPVWRPFGGSSRSAPFGRWAASVAPLNRWRILTWRLLRPSPVRETAARRPYSRTGFGLKLACALSLAFVSGAPHSTSTASSRAACPVVSKPGARVLPRVARARRGSSAALCFVVFHASLCHCAYLELCCKRLGVIAAPRPDKRIFVDYNPPLGGCLAVPPRHTGPQFKAPHPSLM